jgi:DNA polymerase-3 subunit beta
MKFSTLQENLAKGLQTVARAVPTKSPMPILTNVLISAENGRLKLSATNLETAITTYVNASIDKEGSITVPARLIKEFIINLSPSTVVAELESDILHLKSDKTKSRLNGISAEDYPKLPEVSKKAKHIDIKPEDLVNAASVVAFAAGTDSSRPVFTGVYLKYKKNKLTIAATDGFRLSEKTIKVEGDAEDFSVIIPAKIFLEVARIFASSQEPIKMIMNENENLVLFEAEDTLITTVILDGQYPDYTKIIPSESIVTAKFPSEEFLEAVRLTNIFAKEGNSTIKVCLNPDGEIKIVSLEAETGKHESTFPAEVEGESLEMAFNSKYLLDFLSNVKSDQIVFSANGNLSPCVLKSNGHDNFLHIIMPVQL